MTGNIHESGNGNSHGYIVEWRCREGVKFPEPWTGDFPRKGWRKAPYDIEKMRLEGRADRIIRPLISGLDALAGHHSITSYGLVHHKVAKAIIACLVTLVDADPHLAWCADDIEFRARPCDLTYSFKVEKRDMESEPDGSVSEPDESTGK